jgi:hypothetical protein
MPSRSSRPETDEWPTSQPVVDAKSIGYSSSASARRLVEVRLSPEEWDRYIDHAPIRWFRAGTDPDR